MCCTCAGIIVHYKTLLCDGHWIVQGTQCGMTNPQNLCRCWRYIYWLSCLDTKCKGARPVWQCEWFVATAPCFVFFVIFFCLFEKRKVELQVALRKKTHVGNHFFIIIFIPSVYTTLHHFILVYFQTCKQMHLAGTAVSFRLLILYLYA